MSKGGLKEGEEGGVARQTEQAGGGIAGETHFPFLLLSTIFFQGGKKDQRGQGRESLEMEEGEKLDAVWKKGPPSLPPAVQHPLPPFPPPRSPQWQSILGTEGKGKRENMLNGKKVEKIPFHLL